MHELNTCNANKIPYSLSPAVKWFDEKEFFSYCQSHKIDKLARLVLASDGSLTRLIKTVFHSVNLSLKNQELSPLDNDMADYLGLQPGEPTLNREVWLGSKENKKLVYAYSAILTTDIDPRLMKEISYAEKPLGSIIAKHKLFVLRDKLILGIIKNKQIANGFGYKDDQSLWARIYRLSAKDRLISAIFEVFSPELVEV